MESILNSCPRCGSYDIKNNRCNDCKNEFSSIAYKSDLVHLEQPIPTLESKKGKVATFFIDREGILDDNYQLLSKIKLKIVFETAENRKITTQFGILALHKEKPDIIEVHDLNGTSLAQIIMIEKDLFHFSYQKKLYTMDKIGSFPFNVYDTNGNSILTIEDNPDGYTKKLGATFPSYKMISYGKIDHQITFFFLVFIYYFYTFNYCLKPASGSSITVKRNMIGNLKFYDQNDTFIAKTGGYSAIWWIIGIITWIIAIGFLIITYLIIQSVKNGKLISHNGELIGSYKSNFSKKTVECTVPSRNWTGTITFENDLISASKNALTGSLIGSDGNFKIKALTILENQNQDNMFSIFGYGNNFKIVVNKNYDSYKAYLLATVIINKYLIPKGNSIAL